MVDRIFSDQAIVDAIYAADGVVSAAAKSLGCSTRTIYKRRHVSREVAEAIEIGREIICDKAEESLMKLIEQGDFRAINLVLRTLGRDRGYVERIEHAGPTDEQLLKILTPERMDAIIALERSKYPETENDGGEPLEPVG